MPDGTTLHPRTYLPTYFTPYSVGTYLFEVHTDCTVREFRPSTQIFIAPATLQLDVAKNEDGRAGQATVTCQRPCARRAWPRCSIDPPAACRRRARTKYPYSVPIANGRPSLSPHVHFLFLPLAFFAPDDTTPPPPLDAKEANESSYHHRHPSHLRILLLPLHFPSRCWRLALSARHHRPKARSPDVCSSSLVVYFSLSLSLGSGGCGCVSLSLSLSLALHTQSVLTHAVALVHNHLPLQIVCTPA
ncbi:hypothetical protein LX36DRAFT_430225 [Colletotrichum falcatum]|nr:hypothetical protein LX36DRAFT_430225 [Colletotrichum falcatum]